LLAFTKEEEQLFEVINLNKILTDWQELLKQIAGDTIKISLDLIPAINSISGNPEKIRQVIMNLVINACEAMPGGGNIAIKTQNVDFKKNQIIKNEVIHHGSYVSLTLTDSGVGIEEELIDEIFKPFFSKKKQRKGTGLGLSIVKRIVDEMNALISVSSKIGQGTSITIYFPRYEAIPKKPIKRRVKAVLQGRGEAILIVDDDSEVRNMLKNLMDDHLGYSVLTARNGKDALRVLNKNQVSLVITDLKMPDMDGIELLNSIKQKFPDLKQKIIAITAFSENHESNLIELGFRDVLKKPLKVEKFSIIIRKILEEKK
jgi:CheY-like chemotaxis protein